jgi:hypothetical protein
LFARQAKGKRKLVSIDLTTAPVRQGEFYLEGGAGRIGFMLFMISSMGEGAGVGNDSIRISYPGGK